MGRSGGRSPHLALGVLLACCLLSCFEAAVSNVKSIQSLDFVIYSHAHSRQPIDIAEFIAKAKSTLSQVSKFRVFFYATNIGQAEMEERGVPTDWITGPAQSAGGETHTYLKHLVDHKDDHGDFVWFTEAGRGEIERSSGLDHIFLRLPLLTNATGVLALGEVERHSCSHMKYIEKIYERMMQMKCKNQEWDSFMQSEFIVSKKRILNVSPPDSYQHFIDLLNADDMHEIHQEVVTLFDSESGLRSSKQNPLLAHVIERAWNLIWNCTLDVRAPVGKAKKLDPRRAGDESQACCVGSEICAPNTCQCLDVPIAGPPPPTPPPVPKPPPPPRPAAAARTQQAGPVAAASAGAQEAEAAAADAPERKSHWWNFFG